MSVTVTLNAATKRLTILGYLSVGNAAEAVAVSPALAGVFRLYDDAGVAVADCSLTTGAGLISTTGSALQALLAGWPLDGFGRFVTCELIDAAGDSLGTGTVRVKPRGTSAESVTPAGGPLTREAHEAIPAGAPLRLLSGKLALCAASNAAGFVGVAAAAAEQGANVTACRFGALSIASWGLTAGAAYYLPQSGGALTSDLAGVSIVRMVGIATDADTLQLVGGGLTVQAGASGTASYLVWDADAKRLVSIAAAQAGGPTYANKVLALDADGKVALSAIPAGATTAAVSAVRALFSDLLTLNNPSTDELVALVNQIVTRLKG